MPDASDELTTLLRAIVDTQHEIVETLAEATQDIAALEQRIALLESAAAVRNEAVQAQRHSRRLIADAQALHRRSAELRGDAEL